MGFHRAGKLWGLANFGVKPDIMIFGKALTNGLNPLSGIWAREELIKPEVFGAGSTHSTFSSNTLGTAVGLEVMNICEEENYEKMVTEKGKKFLEGLKKLMAKHPKVIGDVSGMGMALRMEIVKSDGYAPDREFADHLFAEGMKGDLEGPGGKKMGLVLDVGGYYKNVFTIAPSFTITDQEIGLAMDLFDQLIQRCVKKYR